MTYIFCFSGTLMLNQLLWCVCVCGYHQGVTPMLVRRVAMDLFVPFNELRLSFVIRFILLGNICLFGYMICLNDN